MIWSCAESPRLKRDLDVVLEVVEPRHPHRGPGCEQKKLLCENHFGEVVKITQLN